MLFRSVSGKNLLPLSWGVFSKKYPDYLNTFHTSEVGHKKISEIFSLKIEKEGLIKTF